MYLVYTPADGDVQRYQFDPNKMDNFDAEAIEKVTNWTWDEWGAKIQSGSILATRALLWVLQRRTHRDLKFTQVRFSIDQVKTEPEPDELIAARDRVLADKDLTDEQRDAQLQRIYAEMDNLGVEHDAGLPKAPESSDAGATPAPSRKSAALRPSSEG